MLYLVVYSLFWTDLHGISVSSVPDVSCCDGSLANLEGGDFSPYVHVTHTTLWGAPGVITTATCSLHKHHKHTINVSLLGKIYMYRSSFENSWSCVEMKMGGDSNHGVSGKFYILFSFYFKVINLSCHHVFRDKFPSYEKARRFHMWPHLGKHYFTDWMMV